MSLESVIKGNRMFLQECKSVVLRWVCAVCVICPFVALQAQQPTQRPLRPSTTRVLLVLDCSNSMWEHWQSDSKIKVSQQVLMGLLDSVSSQQNIEVALRVFGHLNKDAFGTRLEVPFEPQNLYKLQSKIKTLVPNGGCDAASALSNSLDDFPLDKKARNIILVITDGMDDCQGDICDAFRWVQESGMVVKTFVVGIGTEAQFQNDLDCVTSFTRTESEEQFSQALYEIFSLSDQMARVVVDIRDSMGNSYETLLPVVFSDKPTLIARHASVAVQDAEGPHDTLVVDPLLDYSLTIFSKPPVTIDHCHFDGSVLNTIPVKIDQGTLCIRYQAQKVQWATPSYQMLIFRHGESQPIGYHLMGETLRYRAGVYDVVVLSQPQLRLEGVEVRHESTTDLVLPGPGMLSLTKGKSCVAGALFSIEAGRIRYVCDLSDAPSERIVLQAGEYQVVARTAAAQKQMGTVIRRFEVASGKTTNINLTTAQ